MAHLSENLAKQRQIAAQRVSAILYGVVAIMTAELSVRDGEQATSRRRSAPFWSASP